MPDWKNLVRERLQPLGLEPAAEADLAEELAQHLEDEYGELLCGGATEEDARRAVLAELNDMYPLMETSPRMPRHDNIPPGGQTAGNWMNDFGRDLRYAGRTMRKSPLFVVFVVLTLALGIGANTTVFTLINTLILNPLPVKDPGGLAAAFAAGTPEMSNSGAPMPISYADLEDYRARNEVFVSMAGYTSPRVVTWQSNHASERMFCEMTTSNYFSTLGLKPALGRFFAPEEDNLSSARAVAVLNYGVWLARFGGARDIAGKTIEINHVLFTLIGVAPPAFIGMNAVMGPDLWVPSAMAEQLLPGEMANALHDRGKADFLAVGRLKPGATRAQAQANLATIAADLARAYPLTNEGHAVAVRPIRDVLFGSASSGASPVVFASVVLLIVVGIVLLIACSNVANLLLARAAARQREIAVRLAMGASRERLLRQLLTESVLLASLGGALGVMFAFGGLKVLFGMLPMAANFIAPKLDATVFVFALAVSLATGFLFGTIPALKASRASVAETLQEEARTAGRSRRRVTVANALLVSQVAFSFLLLVTAALFLRSIASAYNIDPGFQTANLATFMTNPGQAGYSEPRGRTFYKDVRQRVTQLPGVASVSWASDLPLWAHAVSGVQAEGRERRSRAGQMAAIMETVDLDYFNTAGVAIDRGRAFTNLDRENSAPVAIINEKMAQDYWPDGNALGKRVQLPGEQQMRQIVGIARTANYTNWAEAPQRCVYVPLEQHYSGAMTLYVRSEGDPKQILLTVQREIRAVGPQILVIDARTGRKIVDGGLFQAKMGVALLSIFGLLALGLASIGLYGILAYSVHRRKREIGVRIALGASQAHVLRMILRQGMSLVLTGLLIGLAAALVAGRMLNRMLYGVKPGDPESVAAAAVVLIVIGLAACFLPARSASRVDPVVALREG